MRHGNINDESYTHFVDRIQARFMGNIDFGKNNLFTTDACSSLWRTYLASFTDPVERKSHDCSECRRFIETYGHLVTIDEDGLTTPVMWNEDDAPEPYKAAVSAMDRTVRRARVLGVFLSQDRHWGNRVTGVWQHMAVKPPSSIVFKSPVLTAGQARAKKMEDFKTVSRAISEFKLEDLSTALDLLRSDALYRSEAVLGQAQWLHALKLRCGSGPARNIVWRAIAEAPDGFCHPRSSMIGSLLEDIEAGKSFEEVSRAFAAKMHPLRHMRPQAAPKAGAIAQAESIVQNLAAAGSLRRRFARVDELQAIWRPVVKAAQPADGSVFGHLKTDAPERVAMKVPAQTMTWEKFSRKVLPLAVRIQFLAPPRGSYIAFATAVNPEAPPILQWDSVEKRNPVSWYMWVDGAYASQFGLFGGDYVEVEAIVEQPSMWNGGQDHHGQSVSFILAGAKESRQSGLALFPSILRAEFHGVRSVIEAYSNRGEMEGIESPHAIGFNLSNRGKFNVSVRVFIDGKWFDYKLDRWD